METIGGKGGGFGRYSIWAGVPGDSPSIQEQGGQALEPVPSFSADVKAGLRLAALDLLLQAEHPLACLARGLALRA
jgi:hypothetical protein